MTRWTLSLVAVLSLAVSMTSLAEGQELKKVRMGYPAFSMTFLTFFVAKDAGIYKKHGLDVDMVQMAGAVQTSALVAGEIDYLTGITSPLVAAARGLPFKGILVTHERTLFWLIGNPDRGLVEPEDIDHRFVLDLCRPWLGRLGGTRTDWTPLRARGRLFPEPQLDWDDPWQFVNIRKS